MYFRYSSTVVAPTTWISPRAKAGFMRLPASKPPSSPVPPAPTIVCISSMNKIISPADFTSSNTERKRSSKSPLYFVSASNKPTFKDKTRLFFNLLGTISLSAAIKLANPSAIAVFPTPGSPIKHGLDFRLLTKILTALFVSSSLPNTGSNSPFLAIAVKSTEHCANIFFTFFLSIFFPPAPTNSFSSPTPFTKSLNKGTSTSISYFGFVNTS
mmetsp:Transcript_7337/g.24361  ORF Transcript_7337/g.24361 Transcript_7337/m.24361 type:complete len:213 (-) Transcript_7337:703-1341(-)